MIKIQIYFSEYFVTSSMIGDRSVLMNIPFVRLHLLQDVRHQMQCRLPSFQSSSLTRNDNKIVFNQVVHNNVVDRPFVEVSISQQENLSQKILAIRPFQENFNIKMNILSYIYYINIIQQQLHIIQQYTMTQRLYLQTIYSLILVVPWSCRVI